MPKYQHFDDFKLSKKLQEAVGKARFEKPTELQSHAIPLVLEGNDVVFEAHSGMGKSACFAIPFLQHWLRDRTRKAMLITSSPQAVRQIGKVISRLCPILKARVLRFTNDDDYFYPEFLDKTPIVVLELGVAERFMRREKEYVSNIRSLGLDQFDALLEQEELLQSIVSSLPSDRQTLICANKLTERVLERCRWYCDVNRLEKLKLARPEARWSEEQVKLQYVPVTDEDRFERLSDVVRTSTDAIVLIVTGSDRISEYIVDRLRGLGLAGDLLAYSMQLDAKQSLIDKATRNKKGVLVGCEAAMNGLTVSKVNHLISWDLPGQVDVYCRRIDRFAYENPLVATVLVERSKTAALRALERRLGRKLARLGPSEVRSAPPEPVSVGEKDRASQTVLPKEETLIAQRFREPVFASEEEVQKLAPDGIAKTLGSKFLPARKRR